VVTRTDDGSGGSELLDIQPLGVMGEQIGANSISTEWVVESVKNFYNVVGLSCYRYEDKLMALFNAIEANRYHSGVGHVTDLSAKFWNQGQCEVKRLECLVNYDVKGGQSSRMARKRRVGKC
jgi:hypothetical protein